MNDKVQLIDPVISYESLPGVSGDFAIKSTQHLPDEWLSQLKRKVIPTITPSREYETLFSIPVEVIDEARKRGADFYTMSNKEIARYLRANALDAFIVGRI